MFKGDRLFVDGILNETYLYVDHLLSAHDAFVYVSPD